MDKENPNLITRSRIDSMFHGKSNDFVKEVTSEVNRVEDYKRRIGDTTPISSESIAMLAIQIEAKIERAKCLP